jgi:outer membrane autotransporter protein
VHTACLRHNVELDDAGGTAEAWSAHLGGSTTYKDGFWSADAMLDVFHAQWDTQREIVFNDLDRTAHVDVDAGGVAATVNGAYEFRFGEWRLTPPAGLAFIYQYQDDYTEDGAGVLDLDVDSVDATSLRTQLDSRVARDLTVETRGATVFSWVRA